MAREMKSDPSSEKKLEQYGVWVKVEPEEVLEQGQEEGPFELADLESPAGGRGAAPVATAEETLTPEEEELLDELETELGPEEAEAASAEIPGLASEAETVELPLEAVGSEEAELPELALEDLGAAAEAEPVLGQVEELELPEEAFPEEASAEEAVASVEVPLSEGVPHEEHFDDLQALEDELATVTSSTAAQASSAAPHSPEILARIEEELRSIRGDLTALKKELAVLRKAPAAAKSRGEEAGGFFDEDEDETIALTGDELDNILNTAEITEEPAEGAPVEPEPVDELGEASEPADIDTDLLSYDTDAEPPGGAAPPKAEPAVEELPVEAEETGEIDLASLGEEESSGETASALDLDLEEVTTGGESPAPAEPADLAEELEALPEIELVEEAGGPSSQPSPVDSLDLESIGEPAAAEPAQEAEALPEIEELEAAPEDAAAAEAEELPQEIDLQALSAEIGEESGGAPQGEVSELAVDELEVLPEDESANLEEEKEIRIDFEQPSGGAQAEEAEEVPEAEEVSAAEPASGARTAAAPVIPDELKDDIRTVLKYMDQLLEALPEEKIQEFASSEYFVMYKKLFEDLGLGE